MNMKIIATFSFLMLYITATTSYMKGYGCYGRTTVPSDIARYSLRPKVSLLAMSGETTDGYLKKLSIHKIMNTNIANVIQYTDCDQINITSVYLNIDKVKGVYFAKDVKNVIFTLPYDLSDLYYYDKDIEVIYKVSNKTRINMKSLSRFVFQSFNNNIDGIMF
jgi:hypothetical protein